MTRMIKKSNNEIAYRFIELLSTIEHDSFNTDIQTGLTATPKYLPVKYIYDEVGSKLFEQITQDPGYYLTHAESFILKEYAEDIGHHLEANTMLIELGSGSSAKTRHLLNSLLNSQPDLLFAPIDISGDFLKENVQMLSEDFPDLQILGTIADYHTGIETLIREFSDRPKLILWLGSDIGHIPHAEAALFLKEKIVACLNPQDKLLIGIDLKKEPASIDSAYCCCGRSAEIPQRFSRNILHRLNNTLQGDLIPNNFAYHCFYNQEAGRMEIYLKSLCQQTATLKNLPLTVSFEANELIQLHYSYKYNNQDIHELAESAGLIVEKQWLDDKEFFSLNLLRVAK